MHIEWNDDLGRSSGRPDPRSEAPRPVSCFCCEALHPGTHPRSVCPPCAARLRIMRSLEMSGPFPLTDAAIDAAMDRKSAGNYALGFLDDGAFVVFYVGRSDSDVRQRLHDWVGAPSQYEYDRHATGSRAAWAFSSRGPMPLDAPALGVVGSCPDSSYTRFAYSYAPSPEAAFEKEWRNYDDFGGSAVLDNPDHPTRTPEGGRKPALGPDRVTRCAEEVRPH